MHAPHSASAASAAHFFLGLRLLGYQRFRREKQARYAAGSLERRYPFYETQVLQIDGLPRPWRVEYRKRTEVTP